MGTIVATSPLPPSSPSVLCLFPSAAVATALLLLPNVRPLEYPSGPIGDMLEEERGGKGEAEGAEGAEAVIHADRF